MSKDNTDTSSTQTESNHQTTQDGDASAAMIGYFTLLGWLLVYFTMHQKNPTKLGAFHLRQALAIHMFFILLPYVSTYLPFGGWIGSFTTLLYIVAAVTGILSAQKKELKPMPLFGTFAQENFQFIKEE